MRSAAVPFHASPRARALALAVGLLGHALWLLAVGAMAASLYSGMQLGRGRLSGSAAWVVNALLVLQFPLLHSALLTSAGRRALARLAPAPLGARLATTTYALAAALQLLLVFTAWSPTGPVWYVAHGAARSLLTALFASAWLLLGWGMWDAGLSVQTGALGWTSVLRGRPPRYPPMPSRGLFRLCRQPVYVAFALTLWTAPVWSADALLLAVVWTLYCVLGPLHREQRCRRGYGRAYLRYSRRVPYWIPSGPRRRLGRRQRTLRPVPAGQALSTGPGPGETR